MIVGFLGAGGIGLAFASQVVRAGHDVILSNSRGPETLADAVAKLGPRARAATRQEAALAEVVVIAVLWPQVPAALEGLPPWNGRILVDATNPVVPPDFHLAELGGRASSEVVASLAPGARVVKVGNTLAVALLGSDPREAGGNRVLFMSGDDAGAKSTVAGILGKAGFATVDLGTLAAGARLQQFPGGPLPGLNLIRLA
jgi:predicted dinucleotide-binding enzyme